MGEEAAGGPAPVRPVAGGPAPAVEARVVECMMERLESCICGRPRCVWLWSSWDAVGTLPRMRVVPLLSSQVQVSLDGEQRVFRDAVGPLPVMRQCVGLTL